MLNKESSKLKIKFENGFKENVKSVMMAVTSLGTSDPTILKKLESNKLEDFSLEEQKAIIGALNLCLMHGRHTRADEKKKFISYINQLLTNIPQNEKYKKTIIKEFFEDFYSNSNMSEKTLKRMKNIFNNMFTYDHETLGKSKKNNTLYLFNKFLDYNKKMITSNCGIDKYYCYLTIIKQISDRFNAV